MLITVQLCHCNMKTAIDSMQINECGCVPVKPDYLQNRCRMDLTCVVCWLLPCIIKESGFCNQKTWNASRINNSQERLTRKQSQSFLKKFNSSIIYSVLLVSHVQYGDSTFFFNNIFKNEIFLLSLLCLTVSC